MADRTFRLTDRVCRTLDRATLDPRVIGADVHYLDNGLRSNVLAMVIGGTGQDQELFRDVAEALPYRIIAPTLLGFERVTRRRVPVSLANHLGILRELLRAAAEESGASTVVVCGFSAGGDLAMRLLVETPQLPSIDGVLALGCNLSIDTCWATRVFARVRPGDQSGMLDDLRTLSAETKSLDDWLNAHEYFVNVLRKMGGDLEAIRRFSQEIVEPFTVEGEETFATWYRIVSERVASVRCVWEETETCVRLVEALRMRNLDTGLLGDRFRDDSIVVEAGKSHFDLARPDVVRRHLDAVIEAGRATETPRPAVLTSTSRG